MIGGLVVMIAGCVFSQQGAAENVALGKPYAYSPRPAYPYCTDSGDKAQLTDGQLVEGYFWVQKGTVGWQRTAFVRITIDLQRVYPITGVALRTAAGVAGVRWPRNVYVYVSDDGKAWCYLCNLVRDNQGDELPEYGTYKVAWLRVGGLQAHGRYVQLIVQPGGAYFFCDEIQVFGGPRELLGRRLGRGVKDPLADVKQRYFADCMRSEMERDLEELRRAIEAAKVRQAVKQELLRAADELKSRIGRAELKFPEGYRPIVPLHELHREMFRLWTRLWRAEGKPELRVWKVHRWAYFAPWAEPPQSAGRPELRVRAMRGEVRSDVVNFTNAAERDVVLRITFRGLPGGAAPRWISVKEVLHVATAYFRPEIPAALVDAKRVGRAWQVTVPAGMTRQVWVMFRTAGVRPGVYRGALVAQPDRGKAVEVPVVVRVSRLRMPEELSLHIGGWSYTDGRGSYGVTEKNRLQFIAFLQEHGVNTPWAKSSSMPEGEYDEAGRMVKEPDTAVFDEWVRRWPKAKLYMVFIARGPTFAGFKLGTPQFERAVGDWARFWAEHMRKLGLGPSKLGLLIRDEPHDLSAYKLILAYAKAIKAAAPEIKLFEDPTPRQVGEGLAELCEAVDILCPNRILWLGHEWYAKFWPQFVQRGKMLWFYSCSGPTRSFDPYLYYLLQAWHVFSLGGNGTHFWAFGDNRRVSAWNDFMAPGPGPYCPMYLDDESVTCAKWMEAIRESGEDFEYLAMVKRRVERLERSARTRALAERARRTLERCVKRVLGTMRGTDVTWGKDVDYWEADLARGELLRVLEGLEGR